MMPVAAVGSTVNDHVTVRALRGDGRPCTRRGSAGCAGSRVTALSPARIDWAVAGGVAARRARTSRTGPLGPVIVADTVVTVSGIIAITGRPALPVHPQNVSGLGDSVMNWLRLVVVPLPGNRIGCDGRGALASRPLSTLSVAPECHVGVVSDVALAETDLLQVVAKHADRVEGAGHPQLDVAAGAGAVRRARRRRCRCCPAVSPLVV